MCSSDTKFLTIKKESTSLFKDKGSKHLGFSYKVVAVSQIKEKVEQLRKDHPKCNHICYAYRIIDGKNIHEYCTDDGEPSNSAGAPILGQLKSKNVLNTLVCVVRYFGGTKLGVSGLINAYKTTTSMVLENSSTIIYEVNYKVKLKTDSKLLGTLLSFLSKEHISIINQSFDLQHIVTVKTNSEELERIKTKFETTVQIVWEKI